ncbi:hypothetical protein WP2W18E01_P11050 (plasmid) [Aeromonas caviae]|uniref:Uncharacterized protein n=1 Tax=Aeromonas caviae TaxID=648 RepID=A0A6S4TAW8_AERCA|nr:hypothetical protein WP2W18E01_P11050 [Aeromonas caviae]
MLDKNDVYDRRIINDIPKMPAIMRSAFSMSNIIYQIGTVIYFILMVANLLMVITLFYQAAFIPSGTLITQSSLMSMVLWTISFAMMARWFIPFLFRALVRIWYYTTRSKW